VQLEDAEISNANERTEDITYQCRTQNGNQYKYGDGDKENHFGTLKTQQVVQHFL